MVYFWLTYSKNKSKLLSLKLHEPTETNILKYKLFNNLHNKLVRIMKISYFKTACEENKHKCWSILRHTIGKMNDKTSYPQTFTINNISITDKMQIAEGFNNLFSKIGLQSKCTNIHASTFGT